MIWVKNWFEKLLVPKGYLHKIAYIDLGKLHNKYGSSHKNNLIAYPKLIKLANR